MAKMFSNLTESAGRNATLDDCPGQLYQTSIALTDSFGIFIGQPLIAKLLWTAFHSKKIDVLNINLALFHNVQYLLTTIHLCVAYFYKQLNLKMAYFITVYLLVGGPTTLSSICLERYIAVIHPTFYPLLNKYRCREVCALSLWLLVLPTATITTLSDELHIKKHEVIKCMVYTIWLFMVGVIVWSNIAILKALRTSGPATDKLHPAKKRAFQTVRAIAIIAFLCYTPVGACVLYTLVSGPESLCSVVPAITFLVTVASVAHPIFYLSTTGNLPCLRSSPTP